MMIWQRGYHLKISRFLENNNSDQLWEFVCRHIEFLILYPLLRIVGSQSCCVFADFICLPSSSHILSNRWVSRAALLPLQELWFIQTTKKQWSCRNAIQPMPLTLTNYGTLEGCHNMEGLVHLAYTDRFWLEQFWQVSQVIVYHWFILTSDVILGRTSRLPWGIAGNAADAKRGCSGRTPREGEMGNWPSFPMSTVVDH
jgi:hypothetical protein